MTNERFLLNAKVLNQLQETLLQTKKRVWILSASKAQRKGGNNQVAAFSFVLLCSYSI